MPLRGRVDTGGFVHSVDCCTALKMNNTAVLGSGGIPQTALSKGSATASQDRFSVTLLEQPCPDRERPLPLAPAHPHSPRRSSSFPRPGALQLIPTAPGASSYLCAFRDPFPGAAPPRLRAGCIAAVCGPLDMLIADRVNQARECPPPHASLPQSIRMRR